MQSSLIGIVIGFYGCCHGNDQIILRYPYHTYGEISRILECDYHGNYNEFLQTLKNYFKSKKKRI